MHDVTTKQMKRTPEVKTDGKVGGPRKTQRQPSPVSRKSKPAGRNVRGGKGY